MLLKIQSIPLLFLCCSIIRELAVLYARILTDLNCIQIKLLYCIVLYCVGVVLYCIVLYCIVYTDVYLQD